MSFDSLAVARRLTDAGIERAQADAIAAGICEAAEHGDHVTPDAFSAGLAELRTAIADVRTTIADVRGEIHAAETRLTWRMLAVAGLVIAAVRLFG